MNPILAYDVAEFFGKAFGAMYPNSFIAGLIVAVVVAVMLIKIQSPAPFTLMIALLTFGVIAGFSNAFLGVSIDPISSAFTPVLVLAFLVFGGVVALALWRIFTR